MDTTQNVFNHTLSKGQYMNDKICQSGYLMVFIWLMACYKVVWNVGIVYM